MSLDADLIVDRRRMRRKLTFWRVLAVAVIVLAIAGTAAAWSNRAGFAGAGAYIARVTIKGLIRDDEERVKQLDKLAQSSSARAVIVHVDSPGGTTAGSEQLYDSLMRLKEKKPLVIVVDGLAASGGYITAIAGDHIVAKQTSLVGSIGVLFQYPNVADLLGKLGVKVESIKSSPLNAGSSRRHRRRARRSNRSSRIPMAGSKASSRSAGISTTTNCKPSPTAASSPGIRRSG
jgi:protease-4